MRKISILWFFISLGCFGQYDTLMVRELLNSLQSSQTLGHKFYEDGLFPTQRVLKGEAVEDNTFYYTSTITYLLLSIKPYLSRTDSDLVQNIVDKANSNAFRYSSRNGRASHNFWQTTPPDLPFPNSEKYRIEKLRLPDDLDDSAMIALSLENDSLSNELRLLMTNYAKANNHKKLHKMPKPYKFSEAYRTWFADKWIQDLDMVVMANVLLFVFENDYPLNHYDSATINTLKIMITSDDHLEKPVKVARYYSKASIILYHLARIMTYPENHFGDIRKDVIQDLKTLENNLDSEMDKLLVIASLARLGELVEYQINEKKLIEDFESFYLFYASTDYLFPPFRAWFIRNFNLLPTVYWQSHASNLVFLIEFCLLTGHTFETETTKAITDLL